MPLARRQALCVGIMSYNGKVDFGLIGDYDAMADLDSFGRDLEGAVDEIVAATTSIDGKAGSRARAEAPNGAVTVN